MFICLFGLGSVPVPQTMRELPKRRPQHQRRTQAAMLLADIKMEAAESGSLSHAELCRESRRER